MAKAPANGSQGHAKVTGRKDTGKAIRAADIPQADN
jgi:hypothetical protein